MAWSQWEIKELGVTTGEGVREQAGMKKKEWPKSKQRGRILAVNPPASAVPWSVTQAEMLVQALAVMMVRVVLAHLHQCCCLGASTREHPRIQVELCISL